MYLSQSELINVDVCYLCRVKVLDEYRLHSCECDGHHSRPIPADPRVSYVILTLSHRCFTGNTMSDGKWTNETPDMTSSDNSTDDRYRDVYHAAQFITGLILYPIFCCFGLTGNSLTLVVLRSRKLGGVMSAFLAALAVSDGIKLINDLFYFLVILLLHVRPTYGDLAFNVIYPYAHLVTWLPW